MGGLRITYDQLERFFLDIQKFSLSSGKWVVETTTGMPPLGITGYCCSVIGDQAYYFGGNNFLKRGDLHNSITQLSIDTLHWKKLKETNPDLPVMRRAYGGMVSFECNGKHHLLIIGGMGLAPTKPVPGIEYCLCQKDDVYLDATTLYQTNEHSIYDISAGIQYTIHCHLDLIAFTCMMIISLFINNSISMPYRTYVINVALHALCICVS